MDGDCGVLAAEFLVCVREFCAPGSSNPACRFRAMPGFFEMPDGELYSDEVQSQAGGHDAEIAEGQFLPATAWEFPHMAIDFPWVDSEVYTSILQKRLCVLAIHMASSFRSRNLLCYYYRGER